MSRNVIMIAAIVVIAGYFYFKSTDKSQEIVSQQTNQEQIAQEPDTQPGETEEQAAIAPGNQPVQTVDEALVEGLIKEGVVSRIEENGNSPKVYITSDFYRIPNVDKRNILEVMLKDFQEKNADVTSFTLYDDKSGDEVGTYDANGLSRK